MINFTQPVTRLLCSVHEDDIRALMPIAEGELTEIWLKSGEKLKANESVEELCNRWPQKIVEDAPGDGGLEVSGMFPCPW